MPLRTQAIVLEGLTTATEEFDPSYPYSYCRICGYVYQPPFQRKPVPPQKQYPDQPNDSLEKKIARRAAMQAHERRHEANGSLAEYQRSKLYFTPEAQHKLAAYGIVDVVGTSLNEELDHAARSAARGPQEA